MQEATAAGWEAIWVAATSGAVTSGAVIWVIWEATSLAITADIAGTAVVDIGAVADGMATAGDRVFTSAIRTMTIITMIIMTTVIGGMVAGIVVTEA